MHRESAFRFFNKWYSIEPSPGYAGVSLSLAKTELNARGLHRPNGLRLNPIHFFFWGGGQGDSNYFVHISSSWFEMRLPGSRTTIFRFNPIRGVCVWGWGAGVR